MNNHRPTTPHRQPDSPAIPRELTDFPRTPGREDELNVFRFSSADQDEELIGLGLPIETIARRDITVKPTPQQLRAARQLTQTNSSFAPFAIASSSSSGTGTLSRAKTLPSHRHTTSLSSLPYAPTTAPTYVRTQPLGPARGKPFGEMSHSPTLSGGLTRRLSVSSASDAEDERSPSQDRATVRGPRKEHPRRVKGRSESLPSIPPAEAQALRREALEEELAQLPPNPKLWLPSHLAVYLSDHLELHPLVKADVTEFIRASRLSGRTFLRLTEQDMAQIGINVRWRAALSEARENLRREALGGRIVGFGVDYNRPNDDARWECGKVVGRGMEVEGRDEDEEQGKEEWMQSWRKMSHKSRGRVRGMVFELELPRVEGSPANSPEKQIAVKRTVGRGAKPRSRSRLFPQFGGSVPDDLPRAFARARADSMASETSEASIDSADGLFERESKEDSFELTSPDVGKDSPVAQSMSAFGITEAQADVKVEVDQEREEEPAVVYQLTRAEDGKLAAVGPTQRPQLNSQSTLTRGTGTTLVTRQLDKWSSVDPPVEEFDDDDEGEGTVVRRTRSERAEEGGASASKLGLLFGLEIKPVEGTSQPGTSGTNGDLIAKEMGDDKGSVVLVKRSQLAALERRMGEIEAQLLALSTSGSQSPGEENAPSPTMIHDWMKASLKSSLTQYEGHLEGTAEPRRRAESSAGDGWSKNESWIALGGWVAAAAFGIGLVAGEVVVGRLTGWKRR